MRRHITIWLAAAAVVLALAGTTVYLRSEDPLTWYTTPPLGRHHTRVTLLIPRGWHVTIGRPVTSAVRPPPRVAGLGAILAAHYYVIRFAPPGMPWWMPAWLWRVVRPHDVRGSGTAMVFDGLSPTDDFLAEVEWFDSSTGDLGDRLGERWLRAPGDDVIAVSFGQPLEYRDSALAERILNSAHAR